MTDDEVIEEYTRIITAELQRSKEQRLVTGYIRSKLHCTREQAEEIIGLLDTTRPNALLRIAVMMPSSELRQMHRLSKLPKDKT
jgi:hypothetical protein